MPARLLRGLSVATERALRSAPWAGNVRELRNVIERAVLLCPTGELIAPTHLPPSYRVAGGEVSTTLVSRLAQTERETLRDALELGMNPVTFSRRARNSSCLP